MDILTHAAIGVTLAGTTVAQPALALGLLIGSVLPDLDVLARLLGRRAMMLNHQTFSHSLPLLFLIACACGLSPSLGWMFGGGLFIGSALHVLMDYTNTLGVTLLWPFVNKRLQIGWVFFIDAVVIVTSILCAALVIRQLHEGTVPYGIATTEVLVLACYWCSKGWLKHQAQACAGDDVISLIPSSLVPWHFYVCRRAENQVAIQRLSLIGRQLDLLSTHQVYDVEVSDVVADLPEWQLMRDLSPAYHAIRHDQTQEGRVILCRDLRIRNFNTRFGDLELEVSHDGKIIHSTFHV